MRIKERIKIAIKRAHADGYKPTRIRVHPETRKQYMDDIRDRQLVSSGTVDVELGKSK